MGLKDTFHFDEQAYIKKIQDTSQNPETVLRKKHQSKVRSIHSSGFDAGWGVVLVHVTAGISLIGTGYSLRQIQILARQAHLIEKEMARRGLPIPRTRPRDGVAGLTVGALGAGVGAGVDFGVGYLIAPLTPGVTSITNNLSSAHAPGILQGIGLQIVNPAPTAHGASAYALGKVYDGTSSQSE